MSEERIVVEFSTQGLPETQADIDNLQQSAIGRFTELQSKLELFQASIAGLQGVAGSFYSSLIDSNEKLNQELLKSQVALASTLEIYKGSTQVTDITAKITASQGALRESLKQIEKDTTELVGVTTSQVNGIFQILLQNASSFIGQSKKFSDPIEAATASTKGWAAALGTLGLPLEQANQEIRSILQGDVNNPDSIIAKTLAISKEQYNQWVANGELIDKINEKLAVYVEGNKLASQSVGAITSNITSFFEDTARLAGEPLLAPVVAALSEVYKILMDNKGLIESLAQDNVAKLVELFATLRSTVAEVANELNITPEGFFKSGSELIGSLIQMAEGLISIGGSIAELFGPMISTALGNATAIIKFSAEGISGLAQVVSVAGEALESFLEAASKVTGGSLDLGKAIGDAQAKVAMLTGKYDEATEATATYRDITATLVAQADKIASSGNASSAMVKGQIEQLEAQKDSLQELKTYREEDKASQEAQIAAVEKSIKTLQGLKTAQDELTFKAPELQKLGTMMELLGKNAEAALATINREGGGKKEVFEEAVKSITELTQKQVEYGQITAEQGILRLDAVVSNTKVELETREAALETIKKLEEDFTKTKIGLLDRELEAIERKVKVGSLSELEGVKASSDIAKKQLDLQIASVDQQIAKATELGQTTEKLAADKAQLVSKGADAELATLEKVDKINEDNQQKAYDEVVSVAEQTESARLLALEKGLAAKTISETEYNQQSLEATKAKLAAELAAEASNLEKLKALREAAKTTDQKEALDGKIEASKKKSIDLERQVVKTQIEGQKEAGATAQKVQEDRVKITKESYSKLINEAQLGEGATTLALKKQLANRSITQEEYDKKVTETTKTRLAAELQATNEQIGKLEVLAQNQTENKGAVEGLTEAKKRQLALSSQLADQDIKAQKESAEAVKKNQAERIKAVEESYQRTISRASENETLATTALKKGLADRSLTQEQYDNRLLVVKKQRLEAEFKAEQNNIAQLQALKGNGKDDQKDILDKITAAKGRSAKATAELTEIELASKDKIVDAYKTQLNEKLKGIDIEFSEREAKVRQTEKNETQAAVKLTNLTVERIKAQMAAEQEAADKLQTLGDTKGVAEKKLDLRKLAINLIDAEIKAEQALQNVIKGELDLLKKRLELKKGAKEVNYLQDELKLAEAVKAGTLTKEQAERKKLEITRKRVEAELELLQGLEGKGDDKDQQKNTQDQLKAKIQITELDKQIADIGKTQVTTNTKNKEVVVETTDVLKGQLDTIKRNADAQLRATDSQKQALTQIIALTELEAQSVARVAQLRQAAGNLVDAQLKAVDTGLTNELSLVNAALSSRTKLVAVETQLATDTKLTAEQRVALEKEAVALKAQLAALGTEGNRSELELINQRHQAEQRQLTVKKEQLALQNEMAALELANQQAAIKLDQVRAGFKARELELEAKKLDIQASQLEAQASLTKDAKEAESLKEQAANLRADSANTKELSDLQKQAAEEEAQVRAKLLEGQAKVNELQSKSQQESLETQQKLLNSQQAYERSIKGLKPTIDTKSVDEFSDKIKNIRAEIQKIATVTLPTLKLTPGNLAVSVKDDRSVAPLNALQRSAKKQIDHLASVKASVGPLGSKLDAVTKAVKALSGTKGSASETTVTNQVTVNVTGGAPNPQVTVKDLVQQRKKEGKC